MAVHVYIVVLSFSTVSESIVRVLRNTPTVCSVAGVNSESTSVLCDGTG